MKWLFMALHLIVLHGPNNQFFEINVDEISSVRSPRLDANRHFPHGTRCVITMTNGKFNAVAETCEMADQMIKQVK